MARIDYNPAPGVQQPEKYQFVGNNYKRFGEQPGYIYFPWSDQYYIDPKAVQKQYEDQGLVDKPKSPPGLGEQILPIAASAGALYAGKEIGTGLVDGTLFSSPDASSTTTPLAPTTGANAPVGPGGGGGLLELGSSAGSTSAPGTNFEAPELGANQIPAGTPVPEGMTGIDVAPDGTVTVAPTDSIDGEVVSTPWGTYAQGALGALQLYGGYKAFKSGDPVGGTIGTVAGAAQIGAALGNETAASIVPYAGPIAGAYGAYQTAKYQSDAPSGGKRNRNSAIGGATAGASIGSVIPGVGTVVGAVIGALTGLAGSVFGSSKGKDQMIRDKGREALVKAGVFSENEKGSAIGTLADGSTFDFGKDGKGLGKINYDDPITGQVIALSNIIASGEGMYGRGREAMAHLYTTGALSNAGGDYSKALSNIQHFAKQRGFTPENVSAQLKQMLDSKQLSQSEYNVFMNDLPKLFAPPPPPAKGLLGVGQVNKQSPEVTRQPTPPQNLNEQPVPDLPQNQRRTGLLGLGG